MNKIALKKEKGISLIEVMVSMLVLAFGVLGIAPMVVLSIEGNVISKDQNIAANLLKQKVEHFEGLDSLPAVPYREYEQGLNTIYNRSTLIIDNSSDTLIPAGLYKLKVDVTWADNQNVQQTASFSTLLIP